MREMPHRSYLLRLWQETDEPPIWRAMLESPSDHQRVGFATLDALFAFLEQETARLEADGKQSQNLPGRQKNSSGGAI